MVQRRERAAVRRTTSPEARARARSRLAHPALEELAQHALEELPQPALEALDDLARMDD